MQRLNLFLKLKMSEARKKALIIDDNPFVQRRAGIALSPCDIEVVAPTLDQDPNTMDLDELDVKFEINLESLRKIMRGHHREISVLISDMQLGQHGSLISLANKLKKDELLLTRYPLIIQTGMNDQVVDRRSGKWRSLFDEQTLQFMDFGFRKVIILQKPAAEEELRAAILDILNTK